MVEVDKHSTSRGIKLTFFFFCLMYDRSLPPDVWGLDPSTAVRQVYGTYSDLSQVYSIVRCHYSISAQNCIYFFLEYFYLEHLSIS
jgi:hypothetical protein